MAISWMKWVFEESQCEPMQRLILLKLADNASDEGFCWPSYDTIAKHCGCTRRCVIETIKKLEQAGYIEVTHRCNHNGSTRSNYYQLKKPMKCGVNRVHSGVNHVHQEGEPRSLGGVNHVHPEPSVRTINEPSIPPYSPPKGGQRRGSDDDFKRLVPEGFEDFWELYPRKVGKGSALKAWIKVKADSFAGRIFSALEWQVHQEQWTKDGGQFIPHPATWLNQARWDDKPMEVENHGAEPKSYPALREFITRRY